jgi:hypothetical protein
MLAFTLAIVYPSFWFSQFALDSLPGLLRMAFAGGQLKWVRISLLGSYVASGAPNDPPASGRFGLGGLGVELLLGVAVVVALGALVLYLSRRRGLLACGLFAAMLGYGGFEQMLRRLWFFSPDAGWIGAGLVFIALWIIGLRRVIAAAVRPGAGYGRRFLAAVLLFTVPLGALLLTLHWATGMPLLRRFVWIFIPGLAPAALAGLWPVPARGPRAREISWKAIAIGASVTILLAAAVAFAGRPIESSFVRERAARARAMVDRLPVVPANAPYPRLFFQKGVNFTAEFGAPYASVDALETLQRLAPYGVNAVALVPYGWMRPGQPAVRVNRGLNVWESDEGIEDVARMAHSLGMKVFLKPQLWVRGGSMTEIDFSDPAQRARWFEQYGQFIDHYARLATRIHADLFAVGVELAKLTRYDADWRRIIAGPFDCRAGAQDRARGNRLPAAGDLHGSGIPESGGPGAAAVGPVAARDFAGRSGAMLSGDFPRVLWEAMVCRDVLVEAGHERRRRAVRRVVHSLGQTGDGSGQAVVHERRPLNGRYS